MPDVILRSDRLDRGQSALCAELGLSTEIPEGPDINALAGIYDAEVEKAARATYRRDYAFLGFDAWRTPGS